MDILPSKIGTTGEEKPFFCRRFRRFRVGTFSLASPMVLFFFHSLGKGVVLPNSEGSLVLWMVVGIRVLHG